MVMVFMTWRVTFGNGVRIGIPVIKKIECCGAVLGSMVSTTCGWLLATTTFRIIGATSTDFDVCQDRISYLFSSVGGAFTSGEATTFTIERLSYEYRKYTLISW